MKDSCCSDFYAQDWVSAAMGDSFHPGGIELTRRLIDDLDLRPNSRVIDVACGLGATAIELAQRGHRVVAADMGEENLKKASTAAVRVGAADRIEWVVADAHALLFPAGSFDAVVCECAVSTFENQPAAAAEFARLLAPGGRLGISDMVRTAQLSPTLLEAAGPWACVGSALDLDGYTRLFSNAGLRVHSTADETATLTDLALDLKRKLLVGAIAGAVNAMELDVATARALIGEAQAAIRAGDLQYARLTFDRC